LPAGRPNKHPVESDIEEWVYLVLKGVGFEFAPRIREFLEGQARLHLEAKGVTDFQNRREVERKPP
jgi:hypothetical protein